MLTNYSPGGLGGYRWRCWYQTHPTGTSNNRVCTEPFTRRSAVTKDHYIPVDVFTMHTGSGLAKMVYLLSLIWRRSRNEVRRFFCLFLFFVSSQHLLTSIHTSPRGDQKVWNRGVNEFRMVDAESLVWEMSELSTCKFSLKPMDLTWFVIQAF